MTEVIKQGFEIEQSRAIELEGIKKALAAFQDTVLSVRDPDNMTNVEYKRFSTAGSLLIDRGWPLDRVLDLFYGIRPDATKPELPTRAIAGLMVANDAHNNFEADMALEAGEEYLPTSRDSFQMPFGGGNAVDMTKLLPPSGKRESLT